MNADWWRQTVRQAAPLASVQWNFDGPSRRLADFCRRNVIDYISVGDAFRNRRSTERFYFKHGPFQRAWAPRAPSI